MSIKVRIQQLRLPVSHDPGAIRKKAAGMLRIDPEDVRDLSVYRRSVDARRKPDINFCYTVDVTVSDKAKGHLRLNTGGISVCKDTPYVFPASGSEPLLHRPVITGTGPAGLFCGLELARAGYRPLLFERGEDVDTRRAKVEHFWESGDLDPETNVQFGEGGAGTFSDGKLNTGIRDEGGRNREVLKIFARFGADESILYEARPHIGTDALCNIVKNIRNEIISYGGNIYFGKCLTDIRSEDGKVSSILLRDSKSLKTYEIPADVLILAIGHSARDTFMMLRERDIPMEAKSFAVGFRIEHPQSMINMAQYGAEELPGIGPADYKLTTKSKSGRGVYSFCMCPGGYVINASSEPGHLAVNGMSLSARDGRNANSAIVVTAGPKDFSSQSLFAGLAFQRRLEDAAYKKGSGKIPMQLYSDFCKGQKSTAFGDVFPQTKGDCEFTDLTGILPPDMNLSLMEGIEAFGRKINGFDRPDALLLGVESRTSSPLRILRGSDRQSTLFGLYPCGEGAGYAGGITSAAVDGIKTAETIAERFAPLMSAEN